MTQRAKPLAGIRILDLTRLLPGPVATLHLADLGADVIKIEDPQVGDYARTMGKGSGEDSAYFRMMNRNKRGLRLDLKQPEGREVFLRLAREADVVIESFRPGVVDKLGIGYAAVKAVNPRITYCAISGYGQDGPYRELAGHDLNYLGYAGLLDQIGTAGGEPAIPNFQIADLLGGALTAAMGILAAVIDAQRSGEGRYVDVSMTDSVLAHAYFAMLTLNERGRAAARGTICSPAGCPATGSMPRPMAATWRWLPWNPSSGRPSARSSGGPIWWPVIGCGARTRLLCGPNCRLCLPAAPGPSGLPCLPTRTAA